MELTHAMMWNADEKMFRCTWRPCCFKVTWDQLSGAGYRTNTEHVVFISEKDFDNDGSPKTS